MVYPVDTEAFGTADDYFQAFQAVLKERVHPKHLEMLQEHFNAPGHTITWAELASKVGYNKGSVVNMQYGTFAGRVARRLGLKEKPLDRNGYPWWLWAIVDWAGRENSTGHTEFVLRPEVVEALERLGFRQQAQGAKKQDG